MEIDDLNWGILYELQQNARMSFTEIGRKVGLSAPAIAERIQKLEDAEIITGYQAIVDYNKIGFPLTVIMQFTMHPGKLNAFLKLISTLNEVIECHRVTGNYCLFLKIIVKSAAHLEKLINKFADYGDPTTSVVLSSPIIHSAVRQD